MPTSHPKRSVPWVAVVGLIVIAYPLSVGPMSFLDYHGYFDNWPEWAIATLEFAYKPLLIVGEMTGSTPILDWWANAWCVPDP